MTSFLYPIEIHCSPTCLMTKYTRSLILKHNFGYLASNMRIDTKKTFCVSQHHFQWTVMPFGLQTTPSLYQKVMTKIFDPLLYTALVYIDNILIFSPDGEEHAHSLYQFNALAKKYGIILFAPLTHPKKKNASLQTKIDCLGMHIKERKHIAQSHIVEQLLKFLDKTLKESSTINYKGDFLSKLDDIAFSLRRMLKKNPLLCLESRTITIKKLKKVIQSLPHLSVISKGKRILQTNASDQFGKQFF